MHMMRHLRIRVAVLAAAFIGSGCISSGTFEKMEMGKNQGGQCRRRLPAIGRLMMKGVLRNMHQTGLVMLFLVALGSLAGCGLHKPFEFFDETALTKGGTIAVISADDSDATMRLAEALTKELRERSTFKVWSQAKIDLRLVDYPVIIKEGEPTNPEKPVWFGKGEKAKVDAMQAQLKVRYLFVVWTGFSRTGTSDSYHVSVNGNVVEYPKGRVIGYSILSGSSRSPKGDEINPMLKDSAAMMAATFIKAAKAEKAEKADK
jgi:predicted small lipoprotein YifL